MTTGQQSTYREELRPITLSLPSKWSDFLQIASRLDERALRDDLQHASVTIAFFYFLGCLGFRLGFALHFTAKDVIRDDDRIIVAVTVPYHKAVPAMSTPRCVATAERSR